MSKITIITRADDFGSSQSSNQAIFDSLMQGSYIKNVSCMAVGPQIESGAELLKQVPAEHACFGLHATITSEWNYIKWFPLSEAEAVADLLVDGVTFPKNFSIYEERALNVEQFLLEINHQLDFLTRLGIKVEYLDTHMMPEKYLPELVPVLNAWAKSKGLLYHMDYYSEKVGLGPHSFKELAVGKAAWLAWLKDLDPGNYVSLMHPMSDSREVLAFSNEKTVIGEVGLSRSLEHELLMSRVLEDYCEKKGILRIKYTEA